MRSPAVRVLLDRSQVRLNVRVKSELSKAVDERLRRL